jgi:type I restriction enzyme S subunit
MKNDISCIGDLCRILGGQPAPDESAFAKQGLPFVRMKDLGKYHQTNNLLLVENYLSDNFLKRSRVNVIKRGAIIIPRSGSVALNHRAILGQDSAIVSHICALEIKDSGILDNKFLYYYLTTIDMRSITKKTTGLDAITFEDLSKIKIPILPLDYQHRIASILDHADAIRRKNKEILEKYNQLAQSVFLEMFGDPTTNSNKWPILKFGDLAIDIIGGTSVEGDEREIKDGELGVLKISAVTSGEFKSNEYKVVDLSSIRKAVVNPMEGDLLFSRANTRELVGATCVVDKNYSNLFLPDKLWRIDLNNNLTTNWYIKYLLSHQGFRNNIKKEATGTSGSMLNISKAKLSKLDIPVPQIELQTKFTSIIKNIEEQKKLMKVSLDKSKELFQSLLQRAFRGEL